MTKKSVNAALNRHIKECGSIKAAAAQLGVAATYLSDVVRGRREPGEKILAALGLKRVVQYEER